MESLQATVVLGDAIPYATLLKLHVNYAAKQDQLSQTIGKPETRTIWFEMNDSLRAFLEGLLDPANEVSGLRVYLCNYSSSTLPPSVPDSLKNQYLNKLTVGFVATKQEGDSQNDHPDAKTNKRFLAIDPYNHGKICPPEVCPEGA